MSWTLDLLRTCSISSTNSSSSSTTATTGALAYFFPVFSLMSHSCVSNCKHVVYPSQKVAVLAQTAVAAGEEFTVCRAPPLEPTWKRRARLQR